MPKKQKSANDLSERGLEAYKSGHEFEKQVSELLTLQGYEVELNVEQEGTERDIIARLGEGTFFARKKGDVRVVVQCKKVKEKVGKSEIKSFIEDIRSGRGNDQCDRGLMVSESGFVKTTYELRAKWNFIGHRLRNAIISTSIVLKITSDFYKSSFFI